MRPRKIFISHSSRDAQFALGLARDLRELGHKPWLDEWEIKVGDSIPKRISDGIEGCSFLAVVLSPDSVASNWVEREWHAKYCDEVENGRVTVLPILHRECRVPALLRGKKYADFSRDYTFGLEKLLEAIH